MNDNQTQQQIQLFYLYSNLDTAKKWKLLAASNCNLPNNYIILKEERIPLLNTHGAVINQKSPSTTIYGPSTPDNRQENRNITHKSDLNKLRIITSLTRSYEENKSMNIVKLVGSKLFPECENVIKSTALWIQKEMYLWNKKNFVQWSFDIEL